MDRLSSYSCILVIFYLICLVSPLDTLYCQSPVFFHFNVEDGLPSSEVYDIHQDKDGYLWFATDHGLSRYNGYEFKTFTVDDGLSDNTIFDIREDQNGVLWLSTYSGGISYYSNGKCGIHPINDEIIKMLGSNYPDNLILDEDGSMLITLSLSTHIEQRVLKIDTSNQLSIDDYYEHYSLPFRKSQNLEEVRGINNKIKLGKMLPENNHDYLKLNDETTLLVAGYRLYHLGKNDQALSVLDFKKRVLTIFEDQQYNVWLSVQEGNGVYLFEDKNFSKGLKENFLPGKTISDILQDHEGNYWFSTLEDGIFFLPSKDFKSLDSKENIQNEKVLTIASNDQAEIYFSTFNQNLFKISNPELRVEQVIMPENSTAVFDILFHSSGKIYLSNGYVIDGPKTYLLEKKQITNSKVLYEYSNKDVLFGRIRGVTALKNDLAIDWSPTTGHNFKYIFSICEDRENQLWLGSLSGLFKYSNDSLFSLEHENPLYSSRITKIVEHPSGHLLLATKGAGLLIKTTDSLYQITKDQGLSSNLLKTVFIENDSTFWVASNKGINRLIFNLGHRIQLKQVDRFHRFDGLPSEEINAITKANDLIWLATSKGVSYFDPSKVIPNHIPPKVHITNIQVNGKDTSALRPLNLEANQNDISINFLGLSFRDPKNNRYRFKLNGYDEHFIETENKEVKYTNLPPGDYQFQVTACNSNGIWNEDFQSIHFTINKPITQELWFISLIVLLLILSLYLIIKNLLKRQRKKESLARRLVESEQKLLRAQINPHFIFNAMNSIQYFISDNDKRNAEIYLSRFSTLMRKVLEDSKKNLLSLEEEINSLENYLQLEKLRFPEKFEYELIRDSELDIFETEVPPMIIQPFLENAIWHGLMPKNEKGFLSIKFQRQPNNIMVCTIRDNGIGRKKAAEIKRKKRHQSTGIQNTTERIQIINALFKTNMRLEIQDLFDSLGNSEGTMVRIFFPVF